jgi:cell wall assembly regulator SMI1
LVTEWKNYVWTQINPAAEKDIQSVEEALGIRFPNDFRQIAMAHQGQVPKPNKFAVGKDASIFNNLLIFGDEPKYASLLRVHQLEEEYVPDGIYSFATDPGGNGICFDYRAHVSRQQFHRVPRLPLLAFAALSLADSI